MEPAVSVSVITYQHADYIRQCLDSVLMQKTTFPFEILLGEDDSTDGTREICIEYAEKHPDIIRLFLHDRADNLVINGRPTGRRNLVNNFQQARGRYIAWLDGDDYWIDPEKLQIQFDLLEACPVAAGCYHDWMVLDEATGEETVAYRNREIPEEIGLPEILKQGNPSSSSMFFRNVVNWGQLPTWFFEVISGDLAILLIVARKGPWLYFDEALSVYRRHSGGMWAGVQPRSVNLEEKERFFRILSQEVNFEAWRSELLACQRMETRHRAAAEAREGRVFSSMYHFFGSFGAQDRNAPRYLSPARYIWALLSPVRALSKRKPPTKN